jgi:hypothetical protein
VRRARVPLKSADEYDAFTPWRKFYRWQRGELRKLKRRISKRERRTKRREIKEGLAE